MTAIEQRYELVPVDDLELHPDNPRRGDVGRIVESVEANGFYGAVVAQRSTGRVLAGNHRLLAARQQGLAQVPVIWVDVDDDRARRILLADNRFADLAGYDNEELVTLLTDLPDLAGTGYAPDDLDDLVALLQQDAVADAGSPDAEGFRRSGFGVTDYGSDEYANATRRLIVTEYGLDEYAWLVQRLGAIAEEHDLGSNSEVLVFLVEEHCGETAPAASAT